MNIFQAFRTFRYQNYRFLWLANLLATTSRGLLMTLFAWYVLEETSSAWLVGLVGFCWTSPMLLLGVGGGILADSSKRKHVLLVTQFSGLVAMTTMTVIFATGQDEYWHAYIVMLITGLGDAIDMPSRRSLAHDFMGDKGITSAVALDSVGVGISFMLGPAWAGILIAAVGFLSVGVTSIAIFIASIVLVSRISISPSSSYDPVQFVSIKSSIDNFRSIWNIPALKALTVITVIMNLFLFPYMHILPVVAKEILEVGPTLMGLLQAMPGLGILIGSMVIASQDNVTHHGRIFVASTMLAFIGVLMFSLSVTYLLSMGFMFAVGVGLGGFISMQPTIPMLLTSKDMRGKALGLVSLAIGVGPIGALLVSAVAEHFGPGTALFTNAVIGIPLVAGVVWRLPSLMWRIQRNVRE